MIRALLALLLALSFVSCAGDRPAQEREGDEEPLRDESATRWEGLTPEQCDEPGAPVSLALASAPWPCRWRVTHRVYCGGAAPGPEDTGPICVCDECTSDADCGYDGRCVSARREGARCSEAIRVCTRPGDVCHAGCAPGYHCVHDAEGRTSCEPEPQPALYP
ncbi:MAG: hypothetical protein ACQEXJ_21575 [Myxococcota bacterium]